MHHLPRFFGSSDSDRRMDRRKKPRKPTLERRNAAKHIEYDAASLSSSLDESTSSSLHTRSLDLSDRMSFRVEGIDGEMDFICHRLGLSGPDDFSIPTAAWEASNFRSSSDILPLSGIHVLDSPKREEVKDREEAEAEAVSELRQRAVDVARTGDETEVSRAVPAESSGCCNSSGGGNGIKGIRPPPVLKPPPAMRLPIFDNTCSSWDLVKDFGPDAERGSSVIAHGGNRSSSDDGAEEEEKDEDKEEGRGGGGVEVARVKREVVEENGLRFGQIASPSESCSFTTSNDDDSSSTTTEPMSNISPTGRIRPNITSFEKGALLGRGSFGAVYEAIADDGSLIAVKEVSLLDQGSQGKQSVSQLEQEIDFLSRFEHENIVRYFGMNKDESKLYIFLELVRGSLLDLYRKYNLQDSQVSTYTRQILHGLKYLHDRDVVHRDIKCANILVDTSGSVKLADFGLAKATKLNDLLSCKGTAFWMAPEVVNRKNQGYGLPADIWSLGCTVLEMLTRQIPYADWEPMAALFKIGKGEPPPVRDSLSKDARDFIFKCLKSNPDDRPTAAQLLEHPFVKKPLPTSSGSLSPHSIARRS